MISLKKDYERNLKLINEQLLAYEHNKCITVKNHLPHASQHCPGLSGFV